jgi:hypothetical protein
MSRFGHPTEYCDDIFVIRFAERLRRLLLCSVDTLPATCRLHTQHVTAAHNEETILSIKVMVSLNACVEGDLLCTTQDTSFRRSFLV